VRYPLIFIGTIIEGPILMVACGFFIRFSTLTLMPTYFVLVAGDLLADIAWYYAGYFYAEPVLLKHGKFFSITPEVFDKAKELLRRYHTSILLISKITVGFGLALATIVVAGATKVPFKKIPTDQLYWRAYFSGCASGDRVFLRTALYFDCPWL